MERYKSKLKDFRVAAGLTQQELADETGVAVRTKRTRQRIKAAQNGKNIY